MMADEQVIKKQLIEENGVSPDKIHVIGSGVDLSKFNPGRDRMKFRREMGFSENTPVIVNIGMIRSDKGQKRLMKAAQIILQQHPDERFVVVGQGTGHRLREAELREAIYKLGLESKIIMLGYRWDTPDILAAADMAVFASLSPEGSPLVLREAFPSGCSVISTKDAGISENI